MYTGHTTGGMNKLQYEQCDLNWLLLEAVVREL
jgi:hypothetical protein